MRKQRAFTLVELLVVIAIIALLMSILMPAIARVRQQARTVACMSNMNQWGKIFTMYTMDNEDYFATGSTGKMWTTWLAPYYNDPELHLCPTASKPAAPEGSLLPTGSKFIAWGAFDSTMAMYGLEGVYGSYGMNGHVSNPLPGIPDPFGRDLTKNWRHANVNGANNIPLFLDCIWIGGVVEDDDEPPQYDDTCYFGPLGTNMQGFCINRHNAFINGLFVDSSSRKIGLKELWTLKWHRKFDTNGDWTSSSEPPPVWPKWMQSFQDY